MKLSNSIRLVTANFSLFWKILVYKAFALGVGILFFLPILSLVNNCLTVVGFWNNLSGFISSSFFQNVTALMSNFYVIIKNLLDAYLLLASTNVIAFIYLNIILLYVIPFLLKLSDVPASESMYSYMSSLSKNSFTVNYLDLFGKSVGYSALKTLIEIPYIIIALIGGYGILSIINGSLLMQVFCPLILFVYIVFVLDLKVTLFSGLVPSIVVFNTCAGKAFKKGTKAVNRKFLSILSSFAVVITVMLAIIYMFGIYSLIVVIPLSSLITVVFGQVLFFESQGMNYYVSPDRIINPRKLEDADSIRKIKNII